MLNFSIKSPLTPAMERGVSSAGLSKPKMVFVCCPNPLGSISDSATNFSSVTTESSDFAGDESWATRDDHEANNKNAAWKQRVIGTVWDIMGFGCLLSAIREKAKLKTSCETGYRADDECRYSNLFLIERSVPSSWADAEWTVEALPSSRSYLIQ